MKRVKNLLDERKEREMYSVYKLGFWILFWGMTAQIFITVIFQLEWRISLLISGAVLAASAIVTVADCAKRGIWSEYFKPTTKNNLIASIIAGGFVFFINGGILHYFIKYGVSGLDLVNYAIGGISAVITFALCFISLSGLMHVTKKRKLKLESDYED